MYIFLKRLLSELFEAFIMGKVGEVCEEESIDDQKIRQKYGICTYVLKLHDTDLILTMNNCLRIFILILGIGTGIVLAIAAVFGIIFPKESQWAYVFIPLVYFFLLKCLNIQKNIYKYYKNIVTRDKIIIRRAYKKDQIITYEEISKTAMQKKVVIRKGVFYIPTSRRPIRIEIFGDIYGEIALSQIREKSKIAIPQITEKRKIYMVQASKSGIYNFFGFLLLLIAFVLAADHYENVIIEYFTRLVTQDYCILFGGMGIGSLIIGKILFILGQYKLKKEINDPEHVKISLV